jgi:two-component system response regulator YesN
MRYGEERSVKTRSPQEITQVELEVIAIIRAWRTLPPDDFRAGLLKYPARVMHHFIQRYHGHVKLSFHFIADELGIGMRTLQRAYAREFGQSMSQTLIDARLEHAKALLTMMPPTKISVVANTLGYDEQQDFHYLFEKYVHDTPSKWGRKERAKVKREVRLAAAMRARMTADSM